MYDDIVYVCVYDFNILNKLEGEMQTNDKRKIIRHVMAKRL